MAERSSPTRRNCERAARTCGRNYARVVASKGQSQNHRTSRTLWCPPPGASWRPKNHTNLSPEPSSSARTRARVPAMWPCQPPKRLREPAYKHRQVSVVKIQLLQATCATAQTRPSTGARSIGRTAGTSGTSRNIRNIREKPEHPGTSRNIPEHPEHPGTSGTSGNIRNIWKHPEYPEHPGSWKIGGETGRWQRATKYFADFVTPFPDFPIPTTSAGMPQDGAVRWLDPGFVGLNLATPEL